MTTNNNNDGHNYNFEIKTYNGISIILETSTSYINASRMCSDNNKQWRHFKNTKIWKNKVKAFEKLYNQANSKDGRNQPPSIFLKNVNPEYQGEYLHPKLIHFVSEYCNDEYAFKVAELMDSINDNIHQQLKQQQLPDTPENTKPIFENTISNLSRVVSDNENQQCWGYREHDKYDYLDSFDKSFIRNEFNKFKQSLITRLDLTYEELKNNYPQLLD